MKIYLDNNLGVTNVEQEELTQDTYGYNILKVYIPNAVLTPYDTFTCYYGALLQNGRKVGWFAMEARTSTDADYKANYTLYKATLEQCIVSVEGKVYIGCQVLLGNSGNATLIKKNTAVVQFNVRKSVAINNDILVLDTDQTNTDVLESYKNLLENALTTYATKAEVNSALALKADKSDTYTKDEVDEKDLNLAGQIASARVELNNRINTTDGILTATQAEVAKLKSVQNVVEVVATYSALQSYDTTKLDVNDKVQVIADETHSGASTIYNWNGSAWQYVGAFGGNSYTKQESDNKFAPKATAVTHTGNQLQDYSGNNIYPNLDAKTQAKIDNAYGPAYVGKDTSANILAFSTNKGIYVATDNGHWYYWNGTQYVDGGVYQATQIADGEVTHKKLDNNVNNNFLGYGTLDGNSIENDKTYVSFPIYTVTKNGYIDTSGQFVSTSDGHLTTKPIMVKKGDILKVRTRGRNTPYSVISKTDKDESSYTPLYINTSSSGSYDETIYYIFNEDTYVSVCSGRQYLFSISMYSKYNDIKQSNDNNHAVATFGINQYGVVKDNRPDAYYNPIVINPDIPLLMKLGDTCDCAIFIYDENDNFISPYIKCDKNRNTIISFDNYPNAKYIKMSFYIPDSTLSQEVIDVENWEIIQLNDEYFAKNKVLNAEATFDSFNLLKSRDPYYHNLFSKIKNYAYYKNLLSPSGVTDSWDKDRVGRGINVIWDEENQRYAMFYVGHNNDLGIDSIGVAFSTDLLNWTKYENNPILSPSETKGDWDYGSVACPNIIRYNNQWVMFYLGFSQRGFEGGTASVGYATSTDLINWTKGSQLLKPSDFPSEYNITMVYKPEVFYFNGKYHMMVNVGPRAGLEQIWHFESTNPLVSWTNGTEIISLPPNSEFTDWGYVADPDVIKIGKTFVMFIYTEKYFLICLAQEEDFPNNWTINKIDKLPTNTTIYRPEIVIDKDGKMYLFCNTGSNNFSRNDESLIGLYLMINE